MKVKKDNIIFLNQNDVLTNLKSLLIKYPFKPYYYYNYKEAKIADLFFEHIRNQENGTYIQYTGPQKNLGFSLIKRLKFDSNIFNLKMGRITIFIDNNVDPAPFIQEICKYFSENDYEFIDIAINSMETYLLNFFQNQGFYHLDYVIIFNYISLLSQSISHACKNQCSPPSNPVRNNDYRLNPSALIETPQSHVKIFLNFPTKEKTKGVMIENKVSNSLLYSVYIRY